MYASGLSYVKQIYCVRLSRGHSIAIEAMVKWSGPLRSPFFLIFHGAPQSCSLLVYSNVFSTA
jgi:hypothetical protein